jgi:TRAP-type C4-dicarboxylate transport system permease small subunit
LVALLGAVALGIATRAAGDPLIWTDEAARFLMVWLAALGWILSTRRRGHVRVRFFHDLMPSVPWRTTEAVIQLGMALLGVIAAFYGWTLVGRNWDLEATTMPVSMGWMYVPLIPTGIVTLLQALAELAEQRTSRAPAAPEEAALE